MLRAVDQGMPRAEIVKTFDVSLATLKRYLKQRRETGDVIPKPIPGRPASIRRRLRRRTGKATASASGCHTTRALSVVGNRPWRAGEFGHHEPCHATGRLATKKKTLTASERDEAARAAWREQVRELASSDLVFIDECGSNIALTPR
jgi:hypothetical protein